VPRDRRIRLKEKQRPGFGSGSIWNSQWIDPFMPRRLTSGPFDSLLPARLQQRHQRPTSAGPQYLHNRAKCSMQYPAFRCHCRRRRSDFAVV
jgi:hypothetical protein